MKSVVSIPVELEKYRDAIGIGLFYLALGRRPEKSDYIGLEKKSVRIKLDTEAERYFKIALQNSDFGGVKSAVITSALSYVAENPLLGKR